MSKVRERFLEVAKREGLKSPVERQELKAFCEKHGVTYPQWMVSDSANVVGRGLYKIPYPQDDKYTEDTPTIINHNPMEETAVGIPVADPLFVPFGCYEDVKKILSSGIFLPVSISGPTGVGKTVLIHQACAELKKPLVRMNMTSSTDEDAIIGGFRIVNQETRFFKGPAIVAMEKGAVLLIDEYDLGDPERIMCLQSIMEGSGYFIKQTGEYIQPAPGFTIIATANTKGQGSETGEYIGTQILNEAFLERFANTFDHTYPPADVEKSILTRALKSFLSVDKLPKLEENFVPCLIKWAEQIRKLYAEQSQPNSMSTRRLVQICKTYSIFRDKLKSVELCCNRFDANTRKSFIDFYTKVDGDLTKKDAAAPKTAPKASVNVPWDDVPV